MDPNVILFRQLLGSRIDAIAIALQELAAGESHAREALRRQTLAILPHAEALRRDKVVAAARALLEAPEEALAETVYTFIAALREEASNLSPRKARVLLVGLPPESAGLIMQAIETPTRDVVAVKQAQEALRLVQEQTFGCIVLDNPIPDLDPPALLGRLRANGLTAATPVLILNTPPAETLTSHLQNSRGDATMPDATDLGKVIDWITARLRLAPEMPTSLEHRDPLTGLLNRNALRAAFDKLKVDCAQSREPLSIALIEADHGHMALDLLAPEASDRLLQAISLQLSRTLRASDIVARWSHHQFVALFPGEDLFGGTCAIEKIIHRFREQAFVPADAPPVSLNFMGAARPVSGASDLDPMIANLEEDIARTAGTGSHGVSSCGVERTACRLHRVLVLNGDTTTNRVLNRFLDNAGFDTLFIENDAAAALTALESRRYHVVVIDEQFSGLGEATMLAHIRGDARYNRLPVLIMIARQGQTEAAIATAMAQGASECLPRPFTPQLFMTRLQRLIARSTATARNDGHCRILIADPDVSALVLAASALHRRRYFHVMLAKSCEDALRRIEEEGVNALLVSTDTRDTNRQHLLKRLENLGITGDLDIIVAKQQGETLIGFDTATIKGSIDKPFDMLKFPATIMKLLGITDSGVTEIANAERLNEEIHRITRTTE